MKKTIKFYLGLFIVSLLGTSAWSKIEPFIPSATNVPFSTVTGCIKTNASGSVFSANCSPNNDVRIKSTLSTTGQFVADGSATVKGAAYFGGMVGIGASSGHGLDIYDSGLGNVVPAKQRIYSSGGGGLYFTSINTNNSAIYFDAEPKADGTWSDVSRDSTSNWLISKGTGLYFNYKTGVTSGNDILLGSWNSALYLGNNGRVGISTTSPNTTLDINGNFQWGSDAAKSTGSITGALSLADDLTLQNGEQISNATNGLIKQTGDSEVTGQLILDGSATIKGAVNISANVGETQSALNISSQSAYRLFDILGNGDIYFNRYSAYTSTYTAASGNWYIPGETRAGTLRINDGSEFLYGFVSPQRFIITDAHDANAPEMVIDANGKVSLNSQGTQPIKLNFDKGSGGVYLGAGDGISTAAYFTPTSAFIRYGLSVGSVAVTGAEGYITGQSSITTSGRFFGPLTGDVIGNVSGSAASITGTLNAGQLTAGPIASSLFPSTAAWSSVDNNWSVTQTYQPAAGLDLQGNTFTVGASTFVVNAGKVGVLTNAPPTVLSIGPQFTSTGVDDPVPLIQLNSQYDQAGAADANKIILYSAADSKLGFGVSSNDLDTYFGANLKFWQGHTPTAEGTNVATLAANGFTSLYGVTASSITVGTTDLVTDAANHRVGIGTASPTSTLHVNGSAGFGSGATISTFTANGYWVPRTLALATIQGITPAAADVGGHIGCSDCAVPYSVCIATGTTIQGFRLEGPTLAECK